MLPLRILVSAVHLPGSPISAQELDLARGFEPGFTLAKSGVQTRWMAARHELQSQAGALALRAAMDDLGLDDKYLDCLIAACGVQEQALPSTACAIAAHAGLRPGIAAFDVNASCLSFMQALHIAASLLQNSGWRRIAIVCADFASRGLNFADPEASLIFGDGAAAVIVERSAGFNGLLAHQFMTFPEGREFCEIRAGGTRRNPRMGIEDEDFLFRMNGKAVFKLASQHLSTVLDKTLGEAGVQLSDIDWVVPHQASHLGMAHIIKRLGLPKERVVDIYATHGNQVAASMPTALHELLERHPVKEGDLVLFLGTAAGLSLGASILKL